MKIELAGLGTGNFTAREVARQAGEYRDEHTEDDPSAVHVQIIERGALWWITGGKLVDRLRFL